MAKSKKRKNKTWVKLIGWILSYVLGLAVSGFGIYAVVKEGPESLLVGLIAQQSAPLILIILILGIWKVYRQRITGLIQSLLILILIYSTTLIGITYVAEYNNLLSSPTTFLTTLLISMLIAFIEEEDLSTIAVFFMTLVSGVIFWAAGKQVFDVLIILSLPIAGIITGYISKKIAEHVQSLSSNK